MASHVGDRTRSSPPAGVTAEWLDPHLPSVFSRWHAFHARLMEATNAAVIAEAAVAPGFAVLDVGCGSGFPALALADAVGPAGSVMATDPSPVFVAATRENAARLGLANLEAVRAEAADLPFAAGSFDAATCHMVAMFFADPRAALEGIRRVLRPGRRAAFVAWGPEAENAMFGSFWGAARPHLPPPDATAPPPAAGAPGPGRFAAPGSLGAALHGAGFADVREEARRVDLVWPGPPESLRRFWLELTRLEDRLPVDRLEGLRADVLAAFRRHAEGEAVRLPATVVVASGRA